MSDRNGEAVLWGYCTHPAAEGRNARGFVLARNRAEALTKARARLMVERRRFARANNTRVCNLPQLKQGRGRYRARVWRDPMMSTAPTDGRYYVEVPA